MNTQQILIIHGGTTFDTHEEYIQFLKEMPLDIERLKPRADWKDSLQSDLGDGFEILQPRMPNGTNAEYNEWRIWFEKIMEQVDDDIILIGHSLGGVFLAKYLLENKATKMIKALFLLASPFHDENLDESLGSFRLHVSLERVSEQAEQIYVYHSRDDEVVPFGHAELYHKELPNAQLRTFTDRGHFKVEELPELIEDVKSCCGIS